MSTATTIRTALEAVPSEVSAYIDKAIPTMQVPSIPTDEASSLLACGYAAYNECLILKEFEGWKPLHTLLRLGQRSNASIASILLGLKYDESNYIYTGASEWQESFRISGDTGNLGALNNRERVALAYLESLVLTWTKYRHGPAFPLELGRRGSSPLLLHHRRHDERFAGSPRRALLWQERIQGNRF